LKKLKRSESFGVYKKSKIHPKTSKGQGLYSPENNVTIFSFRYTAGVEVSELNEEHMPMI